MVSHERKLLLFDIDGTLVDTEGAGLISLEKGFFEAFPNCSARSFPPLDLRGATDGSVASFLFSHFDLDDDPVHRDRFFKNYAAALDEQLATFRSLGKGRVLPGVKRLLEELHQREEFSLGLLTGNIEIGARLKLADYSLNEYFKFGAFGDDCSIRDELGPVAIERASGGGGAGFSPERTVIIGDTPKDIACARACGARVVAVATGGVSSDELRRECPDELLGDFSDTAATLAAIERVFFD
tara:strand:- start:2712 stop:3434 length:723 start_codon:yes stop_codon:yes gene_type:complete